MKKKKSIPILEFMLKIKWKKNDIFEQTREFIFEHVNPKP